jgi:hypothetical protein
MDLRVAEHLGYVRGQPVTAMQSLRQSMCAPHDDFKYLLCQQPPAYEAYQPMTGSGMAIINVFDCLSYETEVLSSPALLLPKDPGLPRPLLKSRRWQLVLIAAHVQGLRSHYQTGNDYCTGSAITCRTSAENALTNGIKATG